MRHRPRAAPPGWGPAGAATDRRDDHRSRVGSATGSAAADVSSRESSTARMAPVGRASVRPASIASTTRAPNTIPSSSAFDARRLAPCTPEHDASPAAHSPGMDAAPSRSVTTPPDRWWAAGAMGSQSWDGSSPTRARAALMVGKRSSNASRPVASSHRWSTCWSSMRWVMARATTSRGNNSSTNRSPRASRINAPWPRSASESSGRGISGWCSGVGWNCTNSMSATAAPARSAMAMPSPVLSTGLVVTE